MWTEEEIVCSKKVARVWVYEEDAKNSGNFDKWEQKWPSPNSRLG